MASLFSGCGGLDLGAKQAGFEVVFGNDVDRDSVATFKSQFPSAEIIHGSAADLKKLPSVDVLTGGYPCQSFSMGGRRSPKRDARSILYMEFVRGVELADPKIIVVENVIGLASLEKGIHFRKQLKALAGAGRGYRLSWAKLKAHEYGLPQKRSRIVIVGVRNDLEREYVFPATTHGPEKLPFVSHGHAIRDLPLWPKGEFYQRPGGEDENFAWYYMSRNRKARWHDPSFTIVANWRHVPLHPASPALKLTWSNLKDGFKQRWDFSEEYEHLELDSGLPVLEVPRRLSWREAAVIQTFSSGFDPVGNVESKYRQIGNAVPPMLSASIFAGLLEEE